MTSPKVVLVLFVVDVVVLCAMCIKSTTNMSRKISTNRIK